MPQNHRTFLYLSVKSIAHLPPRLSAVYPLYFFSPLSFPPPPICQLNPCLFHLFPALLSICVNPFLPCSLSSSPYPSPSLPSPSRLFAPLIDMFPFSKLLSLNQIHSSFWDHFSFSLSFTPPSCCLGSPRSCPFRSPWWAFFRPAHKTPGGHSRPCHGCWLAGSSGI